MKSRKQTPLSKAVEKDDMAEVFRLLKSRSEIRTFPIQPSDELKVQKPLGGTLPALPTITTESSTKLMSTSLRSNIAVPSSDSADLLDTPPAPVVIPKSVKINIIRISATYLPVYLAPDIFSTVVCQLKGGVFVTTESKLSDKPSMYWIKVSNGFVQSHSTAGEKNYSVSNIIEANSSWFLEESKRQRMASAVSSMLIKSYPLAKAKRFARTLLKHAYQFYPNPHRNINAVLNNSDVLGNTTNNDGTGTDDNMLGNPPAEEIIPAGSSGQGRKSKHKSDGPAITPLVIHSTLSIEDIMISLKGQLALPKENVFEYIKIASSTQSNPLLCILLITENIYKLMNIRPTLWTTNNLNVLETENVRMNNDHFIMAAANGDIAEFKRFLESGQELTNVHSELKYTALHAAADFGKLDVIELILSTGLSLNIKDPRKGFTALHFAAMNGRSEVAQLLLQHSADRRISCNEGMKPYELANRWGHIECREICKYIVPRVSTATLVDSTIHSLTVSWEAPHLNLTIHSPILEFCVDCVPLCHEEPAHSEDTEALSNSRPSSSKRGARPLSGKPPAGNHTDKNSSAPEPIKMVPIAHDRHQRTKLQQIKFHNLFPATPYHIYIKARSLSGWTEYSQPFLHHTLASYPEQPPPLEVIKITTNGFLLTWHAPVRDNGHVIEYYQIELIDANEFYAQQAQQALEASQSVTSSDDNNTSRPGSSSDGRDTFSTAHTVKAPRVRKQSMITGGGSAVGQGSTEGEVARKKKEIGDSGGFSKWHRLIKHRNIEHRFKYLTGLEPNRPYLLRIRAYNKMGNSNWSDWTGPIAPASGVFISEFNGERLSATINWFAPLLSLGRTVERYELQLSSLKGSMHRNITLLATKALPEETPVVQQPVRQTERVRTDSDAEENEENKVVTTEPEKIPLDTNESNEFVTLSSTITATTFEICNLKAGGKYQCRVRCKVAQEEAFFGWETSLLSDIFNMAATIPDAPYAVRPQLKTSARKEITSELKDDLSTSLCSETRLCDNNSITDIQSSASLTRHNINTNNAVNSVTTLGGAGTHDIEQCLITHDSITITWNNGNSNGSAIDSYIVEVSKIRNYRFNDLLVASNARHLHIDGDALSNRNNSNEVELLHFTNLQHTQHMRDVEQHFSHSAIEEASAFNDLKLQQEVLRNNKKSRVEWTDVSSQGAFLDAQSFQLGGLTPGATYIFRVKQHNACGWSGFSNASGFITTYLSTPPQCPEVVSVETNFAVLRWSNAEEKGSLGTSVGANLTTLEYDLELSTVVSSSDSSDRAREDDCDWFSADSSPYVNKETSPELNCNVTTVMVRNLVPGVRYVARVRARTVLGWSPWTQPSEVFKMHN